MTVYKLGEFTDVFLKSQGLENFYFTFRRRGGRAKRTNANIGVRKDITKLPRMQGTKTANELVEKLVYVAPVIREWMEVGKYTARLYDTQGEEVKQTDLLKDLRNREANRHALAQDRATRIINRALSSCDKLNLEPAFIKVRFKELAIDYYAN